MPPEDARAATEAAIELTERDRMAVEVLLRTQDEYDATVEWEADGATFTCHVADAGDADALFVSTVDGPAAFEIDAAELRENLDVYDVLGLGDDVVVHRDDREWFESTWDRYRADATPTEAELERLRANPPFEYLGEYERPGVRAVVSELREHYRNGTAVAGEFRLTDDELAREMWEEDGLEYTRGDFCLGDEFLRSDAVVAFLDDATPAGHIGEPTFESVSVQRRVFADVGEIAGNGSFDPVPLTRLGSYVAERLANGGAYEDFEGGQEEAQALGQAFSHAIRDGDWTRDVDAYAGNVRWTNWFVYTILFCDTTIVVTDREAERIRLFVATDSD